jgi:BON domain-containing protein
MMEPFFGTASPIWAGSPSPGLGWLPTPVAVTYGPSTQVGVPVGMTQPPSSTAVPLDQPGLGARPVSGPGTGLTGPNFTSGITIAPTVLGTSPYPTFFGPEVSAAITAPALLAAVAVRRGQPMGPTNDQEIEDFIYDALDLLPGTNEIEVRCEGGRVTLTGSVQHKRLKRDVGEIAWAIPGVNDVQNNVTIVARRRQRPAGREIVEPAAAAPARKQA